MVAHRLGDPVILRLIGKWLNAGFMAGGVVTRTEERSPQGGPISPILANIYLHFVLDLWFEKKVKPWCKGEAYLTRFADDFVVNFQYRRDAEGFKKGLTNRFGKCSIRWIRYWNTAIVLRATPTTATFMSAVGKQASG